jgi:hypothetical protein
LDQGEKAHGDSDCAQELPQVVQAPHVQDLTAHDVAAHRQWEVDHSPPKSYRTAHNRVTSLFSFLKAHDASVRWKIPPFDERLPETYEDEEIDLLLGACDAHHRAAYSIMDTATHPRWLIWSEAI